MSKSYTIDQWCALRAMSRPYFYVLASKGQAPKTYNVGRRRYITAEADAAWLAARESASQMEAA